MFPNVLLPDSAHLEVETIATDEATSRIEVNLKSNQSSATCPMCQTETEHIHSRYQRTLADLPWAEWAVQLHVEVRRFFCHTEGCPRWIFTERLPQVAKPWARRTTRLAEVQRELGLAIGASMSVRLSETLAMPTSLEVVLCLVRQTEISTGQPVRVLGVDDWAMRKGRTYGTILVDLEKGEPIDLLPDRCAETLAAWLKQHPEVEIISRDRAGAYAEGAKQGAPNAIQIADRWHLLHNLGDALAQILGTYQRQIQQLTQLTSVADSGSATALSQPPITEPIASPVEKKPRPSLLERQQQSRTNRLARFEEVREMFAHGATLSAIAQKTGLDRKTVRKFVQAETFPERQAAPQRSSILDPYKPYLLQRFAEGCRTGAQLWREIQTQGYQGGRLLVVEFIAQLRKAQGLPPRTRMVTVPHPDVTPARLTPRTATWTILKRLDQLNDQDRSLIERLRALHPSLDTAISLTQEFAQIIRAHLATELDTWLAQASNTSVDVLRRFAAGIQRDYDAVKAAVSTSWSNGPVEGQVNRLKFVKRQMFGRAKFDLLRKRVLAGG